MLHETLIRLWHNCEDSEASELYELQEFLHPGEKELLQCILEIASDYHKIVAFCDKIRNTKHDESTIKVVNEAVVEPHISPSGLYIQAFANGVLEVLKDYTNEIIRLEESFLQNPQLPLIFVFSSLEKYKILFNMLKSVIEVLQKDNLSGCLLMGRLHKYIYCGVETIANAAEKITQSLNSIFYRHLCNWIIYGDLVDIYNEFFICDGRCPDEDFLYPEQIEENSLSSSWTIDRVKNRIRRPPPVRKFYINWSMVPMFINEDIAERILFMGRIVWIVRNDPKKVSQDQYQTKYRRDIWEGKDIEYYKKVQALEKQVFNQVEFQHAIEECRIKLTKYLWSVMVEEGNLKEHLQLIRDYYALGRGELFHQFIAVAENHLKGTSVEHNTYNLNFIFLEIARKIYGENDKTYLKFELAISKSDTSSW
jgi:gamma-tubulin complex component 4